MRLLNRFIAYTVCGALLLSGCVTTGGETSGKGLSVGPQVSSVFNPNRKAEVVLAKPKLDIIIPVFDPGLSKDAENYKEEGVWPELRRAEANRFAYKLKQALEATGAFGAVRVTPGSTATGDLYVMGKIVESDGEDVEISLQVVDITGRQWLSQTFDHEIEKGFHKNPRNEGKDPYDPVFEEAANRIAQKLETYSSERLTTVKRVTELRFGANLSEDAFMDHLSVNKGRVTLASFPSENDPMLRRIRAIRVRDQLFVDGLQDSYRSFSDKLDDSYLIWQEQSLLELQAKREARLKAAGEAAVGVLAVGLAILAIAAGANSNNPNTSAAALGGGLVAGTAGAVMLQKSFQTSEEAKVHRQALEELGESININIAPQVIAFEEETVELTGDAKEQFVQWREFLQKIYSQERPPEVKL